MRKPSRPQRISTSWEAISLGGYQRSQRGKVLSARPSILFSTSQKVSGAYGLSGWTKEGTMAIDERSRHSLFLKLEQVLGPEEATTLIEYLPPVGWADVATKTDLDHLRAATKADMDHHRAATKQDIDQLRVATKKDMDHLGERFETRLEATEHKLIGMFRAELNLQTRTMFLSMSSLMVTIAALAFTAARLI
jgi:hypothetical protein